MFTLSAIRYCSLAEVTLAACEADKHSENVRLKNKWIAQTGPHTDGPLPVVDARNPLWSAVPFNDFAIREAECMATDATVNAPVGHLPPNSPAGAASLQNCTYSKGGWTYGQALAYVSRCANTPLLVDMESYGVGKAMEVLNQQNVLVLRVVTDDLSSFDDSNRKQKQLDLLSSGTKQLASVLN